MLTRILVAVSILVVFQGSASAQVYDCDSLKIYIAHKDHFVVKEYTDLNIDVA